MKSRLWSRGSEGFQAAGFCGLSSAMSLAALCCRSCRASWGAALRVTLVEALAESTNFKGHFSSISVLWIGGAFEGHDCDSSFWLILCDL